MTRVIMTAVAAILAIGWVMTTVSEANGIVCTRGVFRTGCAGPRGAVVTHRRVYAPRASGLRSAKSLMTSREL